MNRLPSIRRWGVAALTGVTLFGGLSIIGAGVASAATPTVSAAFNAGDAATNISGNATASGTADGMTLTITGAIAANDQIKLTLACPSSGTASFAAVTMTGTGWTGAVLGQSGSTCSTYTLTAGSSAAATTIDLSGITYTTVGANPGALPITGTYSTLGQAATNIAVPTDAIVVNYAVTSNTPAVTLAAGSTTAVSPIAISQPTNLVAADALAGPAATGTAPAGTVTHTGTSTATMTNLLVPNESEGIAAGAGAMVITAGTSNITALSASGLPTGVTLTPAALPIVVATPGAASLTGTPLESGTYTVAVTATDTQGTTTDTFTITVAPAIVTFTLPTGDTWAGTPAVAGYGASGHAAIGTGGNANLITMTVTSEPLLGTGGTLTLSGVSVVTTTASVLGAQNVTIGYTNPAGTAVTMASVSAGTILGTTTTIFGADGTADGTVAAEFENAYPASASVTTSGNRNVVLATDAAHTNGSDALAASYLEGQLNTGLLITPATTLGVDARQALQLEGVTTVYVVGGPLAVSPAVIAQIKAMPAYNPGGLTTTGSNINVVGPIYGADGTAEGTAAAIATHFSTAYGSATFAGAYTGTGIGDYNTTTGLGSTTSPGAALLPTAVVVASTDWQDAMSIAPEAFNKRFPVVLAGPSSSTTLGADALSALTSLGVKQVIIIGGQLALQNSVETQIAALNGGISVLRIAGIDATDTAAQIANFALSTAGANTGLALTEGTATNRSVIASHGDYWSDALGAAALGGGANTTGFGFEPIILTENPTTVGQYTTAELKVLSGLTTNPVTGLTVLGGPLAMPSSTVQALLAGL